MRKRSLHIVIGLLVVLVVLTNLQIPQAGRLKNGLSDLFIPFLTLWSRVENSMGFLFDRVRAYSELQKETTRLKTEILELQKSVAQSSEMARQNRELRSMLDFKNRSELKLLSAKVIGRDPSNWWKTLIVDRGSKDGITPDMPVLTVDGLVGKTISVTQDNAQVLLIVDENCKVSSWLNESGLHGIVQGNILKGDPSAPCRMTFIDRNAQLKINEAILTSGLGKIFPKGIPIGKVSQITPNQDGLKGTLYQEVSVSTAVDLARIDEVFIGIESQPAQAPDQGPKKNPPAAPSRTPTK